MKKHFPEGIGNKYIVEVQCGDCDSTLFYYMTTDENENNIVYLRGGDEIDANTGDEILCYKCGSLLVMCDGCFAEIVPLSEAICEGCDRLLATG